ncbi:hypothetical protein OAQ78_01310 [Amylibacter sp.]|nr:hypothetical protein [Amylibacter sp.]
MPLKVYFYFLISIFFACSLWDEAIAESINENTNNRLVESFATTNLLTQTPISMMDFYLYQFNKQLDNLEYSPFEEIQISGEYNTLQAFYSDFLRDEQTNFVSPAIILRGQLFYSGSKVFRKTQAYAIETCEKILDAIEITADIHFMVYTDLFRNSFYKKDLTSPTVSITKEQLLPLIYLRGRVMYGEEKNWQMCGRFLKKI